MAVWTYIIYLGISVAMTVWVAQTLFKHGKIKKVLGLAS